MARGSSNFAPRLRRMLLMVPWLLEAGGSTVGELAARFGVSEDDVVRDLTLVMCCGVPPYGAEHMITVVLDDDGSVLAWKGPFFTRPMRLTPAEGFALLAAGRTLLAVPGADASGPLATALAKLESALGAAGGSVAVELEAPPLLGEVRDAVASRSRLAVEYFAFWRDEVTSRVIDPYVVFSQEGRWYVAAADSLRGVVRHFRVDRFASVAATGETFDVPPGAPVKAPERAFTGGPEVVETIVVVPPSARWVSEAYDPLDVEELADGRMRLRLAVAGERWLERLLLRVGPDASIESPPEFQVLGASAARRLLARYDSGH